MINGVFVPAGNPSGSQILQFEADIVASGITHASGCPDGVRPGNFWADAGMQESLRTARQACERRLANPFDIWKATLLPAMARPITWPRLLLAVFSFLGCVIFSVGCLIWAFAPVSPSVLLLPGWKPFLFSSVLFYATIFLLPQQILPGLRSLVAGWPKQGRLRRFSTRMMKWFKQLSLRWWSPKELESHLDSACFVSYVGHRSSPPRNFFGPSAGLTFFCAFVEAVARSGHQRIRLPWQECLLDRMNRWVTSVALGPHEEFEPIGTAPEFPHKVTAILEYNDRHPQHPLTLAVFAWRDFNSVDAAWSLQAGERLVLRPAPNQGCMMAECPRTHLKFLFCRHLDDFIYFLYPWEWSWLVFRVSTILAILILAFFIKPPTPPEFTFECVPPSSFSRPGIYSVAMLPGQIATCYIRTISQGCPGPLNLDVESNYSETVSTTRNGELSKQFSLTIRQDPVLFFFTMPPDPPPNEIVAVITMHNGAGKYSQATIFFVPRQASP